MIPMRVGNRYWRDIRAARRDLSDERTSAEAVRWRMIDQEV